MCNVPANELSEREHDTLLLATQQLNTIERLELLHFLGYPEELPKEVFGRVLMVTNRILDARARGNHID